MEFKDVLYLKIPPAINISFFLFLFVFMWGWFSSSLILKVSRNIPGPGPEYFGLKYENVSFKTSDGVDIAGWFIHSKEKSNKTIIICHGCGADSPDVLPVTLFLNKKTGFNLLFFDFRNHGRSGGKVSSLGRLETYDLIAAVDFLKTQKPEFAAEIGVFGISMGGAVAITAAAVDRRIGAVVADSPFSSFNYIISRYAKLFYRIPKYPLVPVTLFFTRFRLGFNPDNASAIRWVSKISPRPVFFVHGDMDERIPLSESIKLYNSAGEPKQLWTVKGAGHMESYSANMSEYERKVGEFYSKYLI